MRCSYVVTGLLADRCIREARETMEDSLDGAYAISFRSDDRLVISTAGIYTYNKASFASRLALLRAKVKRPLHDRSHGIL